jgi:hypothetical protein
MPQALRVERAETARSEAGLQRLLVECRAFSGEFPDFLANHLPMVLVAMHRLGGSDERLSAFFATYRDANRLPPPPARVAPIARESWDAALGDRGRESDYRDFFHAEVARIALGYWAATYLELGVTAGNAPVTDDPAEVLLRMRPVESFRGVETELDLLWHFMRAIAAKPEFRPIVDSLAIGPGTAARMREASLALYAGTMDFCALHAVTGCHWLRMLRLATPDPQPALRYFWQAIAALYPKIGFPELPDAEAVEGWRRLPCPAWPEIEAAAVRSDDEHDLSLVFSAREEFGTFGDRLYQVVAARRMQLIP